MPLRSPVPLRSAVLTAGAAAGLAALLLGGSATYASWTASTDFGSTTIITAGELSAEITQTGPETVQYGEAPSGMTVTEGSEGIIPGVQGQRWTYTLTNTSTSSVAADTTLRLRGGPVGNTNDYSAIRPFVRGVATVDSRDIDIPASAFAASGLTYDVDLGTQLDPGQSATVTLFLDMPPTITTEQRTVDVTAAVQGQSSASLAARPIFTMTNQVLLEQASNR